jgi:hypothetical protein
MMDDIFDRLKADKEELSKWIGVYIGVLAVLLAVCSVGGGNAAKDATRANIDAADTWAFYQAKSIRRTSYAIAAEELELTLTTQPALAEAARKAVESKIRTFRAEASRLKSEPKEGTDQLLVKAKALEAERDVALRRDPYFDWSQALIQIAIVLASVHLIIGNYTLLGLSGGLAGLGVLLMLNGYTLLVRLPFLG